MIRQGTALKVELLCASRLIGLQKPDGGVRPIAIRDLIYKVALKAILLTSFQPIILLSIQLGVNSIGGVVPAIFLLDEAISGSTRGPLSITSFLLSNSTYTRAPTTNSSDSYYNRLFKRYICAKSGRNPYSPYYYQSLRTLPDSF
jgi:hypothetical protein